MTDDLMWLIDGDAPSKDKKEATFLSVLGRSYDEDLISRVLVYIIQAGRLKNFFTRLPRFIAQPAYTEGCPPYVSERSLQLASPPSSIIPLSIFIGEGWLGSSISEIYLIHFSLVNWGSNSALEGHQVPLGELLHS